MRHSAMLLLVLSCAPACTIIQGDRILGRDLARADARFASLPPELVAGFAPVPGIQRLLDVRTLSALGKRYGIPTESITGLCFERETQELSVLRLKPVLESVLPPDTRLEIVDFSRYAVPSGDLEFSLKDLSKPPLAEPDAPIVWRGRVRYGRRTATIWAKVRITRLEQWLETATAISPNTPIQSEQIVVKSGWRFPMVPAPPADPADVIGKRAVRHLPAGQVLSAALLAAPPDITRGDPVEVEVRSGDVHLRFAGSAEASGRSGDVILVAVEDPPRRVKARVQAKGKVVIDVYTRERKKDALVVSGRSDRTAGGAGVGPEKEGIGSPGISVGPVSR
jgi:flagella basal body P-ring formation protein FlgA